MANSGQFSYARSAVSSISCGTSSPNKSLENPFSAIKNNLGAALTQAWCPLHKSCEIRIFMFVKAIDLHISNIVIHFI